MTFDPDYGKTGFARRLFRLRFYKLNLTQEAFAVRFGLSVGMIRDVEQGRSQPSRALRVLIEAIAMAPARVAVAALRASAGPP